MTDPSTEARARGRRNLILVGAVFLLPVIASFALYYGDLWKPSASAAKGELIQPPRTLAYAGLAGMDGAALDAKKLEGKWTLIYIGAGECDDAAITALTYGRQTRLALGKDMDRVQRVFIRPGNCERAWIEREQPGLIVLQATGDEFLRQFPGDQARSLYVVDPLHNLMMRHDATRVVNKDLLTDLKKLLKLSHIG